MYDDGKALVFGGYVRQGGVRIGVEVYGGVLERVLGCFI